MNSRRKEMMANGAAIAFILCGAAWIASQFVHIGGEYTNNAQVRQDMVTVSSRVQGFIAKVCFDEFQHVRKGDTLVVIEDSEFRLRLAQAQADYQNALAGKSAMSVGISATQNHILVNDAGMKEVEILLSNAAADHRRYKNLLENGAVTQQQFDAVFTQYESLKAKLETMQRQKQSTRLAKEEQTQRLGQNEAHIEVCRAALDLAKLNLSYTVILAPCDGYTSRKTVQEGELATPGKYMAAVVNDCEKWVVANYRETQMKRVQIGSKVRIRVDAVPDAEFEGTVAAVANATGAQFSPASPDNSAGNFVKVEQRIPVKIVFSEGNSLEAIQKLRAGMNAECTVRPEKSN